MLKPERRVSPWPPSIYLAFTNAVRLRRYGEVKMSPLPSQQNSPTQPAQNASLLDSKLQDKPAAKWAVVAFSLLLLGGVAFIVTRLSKDLSSVHQASVFPYILLGLALVIALGFEFVNGFHDTANAVATVIYTHSLEPHIAVVWSGFWNFVGVITSSGAVAFSIVAILPIELILRVSKGSGFTMVFALLVAAVVWNLATWWRGLPVSSSHTMIGSILGVSLANSVMTGHAGHSGVDWQQVLKVFEALVFSPIIGFTLAAALFFLLKHLLKDERLYKAPEGEEPPPFYIRAMLILTLYRRVIRAWLQRRTEGHGLDHAGACGYGANGVRAEPRRGSRVCTDVCGGIDAGGRCTWELCTAWHGFS